MPSACQKLITCQPNSAGVSQFHRLITTKVKTVANSTANSTNFNPLKNQFLFMLYPSYLREFVVNRLQSLAQVGHRVVLAREQRVYANPALRRQLFEAIAHQFVGNEYFALLLRQFIQSRIQFLEQHSADEGCLRAGIRRG